MTQQIGEKAKPQPKVKKPQKLRAQEMAWINSQPEELTQYAGQWVAIEGEEIISSGSDAEIVLKEARKAGRDPMLFKVRGAGETVVACL